MTEERNLAGLRVIERRRAGNGYGTAVSGIFAAYKSGQLGNGRHVSSRRAGAGPPA
jgi:hypothetical protein